MGLNSWEPAFSLAPRVNRLPPGLLEIRGSGDMETQSKMKELKEHARGCPPNKLFC